MSYKGGLPAISSADNGLRGGLVGSFAGVVDGERLIHAGGGGGGVVNC